MSSPTQLTKTKTSHISTPKYSTTPPSAEHPSNKQHNMDDIYKLYKAVIGAGVEILHASANTALHEYFSLMNIFLSGVKEEFEKFVPSGNDVLTSAKMNESLLSAIEIIANSPEFKEKWKKLSITLANLLKIMMQQISDTIDNEAVIVLDKFQELLIKIMRKTMAGLSIGIQESLSEIPVVGPVLAVINVIGTGTMVGSETIIKSIETMNVVMEGIAKIVGGTVNPLVLVIKDVEAMFDMIKGMVPGQSGEIPQITDGVKNFTKNMRTYNTPSLKDSSITRGGNKNIKKRTNKKTNKKTNKRTNKRTRSKK